MTDEYMDKLLVIPAPSVQEITDRLELFGRPAWVDLLFLMSL